MAKIEEVRALFKDLRAVLSDQNRTVPRLRQIFDEMTTEIETLKMASVMDAPLGIWTVFGLTKLERIFAEIVRNAGPKGITKEAILFRMYANRNADEWPDIKIVDVMACKARAKLRQANAPFWIETIWGDGYVLHDGRYPDDLPLDAQGARLYRNFSPLRAQHLKRRKGSSSHGKAINACS